MKIRNYLPTDEFETPGNCLSGDVEWAVGYYSLEFKGESLAEDGSMGVSVQMVCEAMGLDEITKRVSFMGRRGPKTESWSTPDAKS